MADQAEGVHLGAPSSGQSGRVSILPPLAPRPLSKTLPGEVTRLSAHSSATPRSARALTRKLQDMLKKQRFSEPVQPKHRKLPTEKFQARNWKQLTDRELKRLSLIEQSRYLAYEPVSRDILDKQLQSARRVQVVLGAERESKKKEPLDETIENEWDGGLVGYLKAAEARNRLRCMRVSYDKNKEEEIKHLIASQSSSIDAVRLKCLLQPAVQFGRKRDFLAKHERERCETLLEDTKGLFTGRTL